MSRQPPRMFFCHIPKTAGGTVTRLLREIYPRDRMLAFESAPQLFHVADAELARAGCIAGHAGAALIGRLPEDTLYVTVLRDPVERLRSLHQFFSRKGAIGPDENFATFIKGPQHRMQTDNVQAWMICHDMNIACRRMFEQRKIDGAAILEHAKQSLRQFHLIGFQEELDTFIRRLTRLTDHDFHVIPDVHRSRQPRPALALDDEATAALDRLTALDRELYAFARQIAEEQWRATCSRFKKSCEKPETSPELSVY